MARRAGRSRVAGGGVRPVLIAGDEVIVSGETRYSDGEVFSNLWQLTFAPDGRCSRFVEWYLRHPKP